MHAQRIYGLPHLHLVIQITGAIGLFWLVYFLVNLFRFSGALDFQTYLMAALFLLSASLLEFVTRPKKARFLGGLSKGQNFGVSERQTLFVLVAMCSIFVLLELPSLSRVFLASFMVSYFGWITWTNRFGFRILNRVLYRNRQKGLSPTLLVGSSTTVAEFNENSNSPTSPGTLIQGCVLVDTNSVGAVSTASCPVLGCMADLEKVCSQMEIRALMLLGLSNRRDLVGKFDRMSKEMGIRMIWIDDVAKKFGSGIGMHQMGGYSIISPRIEPLEVPINRLIKRLFDIVVSAIGILLVLPFSILIVGLIHLRYSRGPLFYRQARSGRNGEEFQVFKFRSMSVCKNDTFIQARQNDSRIFPGGDFIRKYSIDELPQLLNVFMGQMSIVGPRPHPIQLDHELAPNTEAYKLRHLAKPGITGLAQSRGWRGETREQRQIESRVRLDLFYIKNWSLALDIRIIFETAWQCVFPPKSAC